MVFILKELFIVFIELASNLFVSILFVFLCHFCFICLSFHFFTINEIIKSYNKIYYKRTKNIASSGPDPPDAHMVVTARTGSGRDHHKVTRVWNYHQVKAWYQTLYQRLCATKKANAKTKVPAAHQNYMRSIPMNFSTQQNALMQAAMQQPVVDGRGKKRPYPGYPAQNNVQQMMSMQGMMPGMVMPNMPNMQNQMGQMMSNMGQFNFPQNVQQMMQLQGKYLSEWSGTRMERCSRHF